MKYLGIFDFSESCKKGPFLKSVVKSNEQLSTVNHCNEKIMPTSSIYWTNVLSEMIST